VNRGVPAGFEWRQALDEYHRLPEWIGYFTQAIDDDGWPTVVATWVPRLMPAGTPDRLRRPAQRQRLIMRLRRSGSAGIGRSLLGTTVTSASQVEHQW
jgi:hypothetical protein